MLYGITEPLKVTTTKENKLDKTILYNNEIQHLNIYNVVKRYNFVCLKDKDGTCLFYFNLN